MAIFPLRNLGQYGVVTDVDPYDLPLNAWSLATNIRFVDGKVERGPVYRKAGPLAKSPRLLFSYTNTTGLLQAVSVASDGTVSKWAPTATSVTETDLTPGSWTPSVVEQPTTQVEVNNLLYVNRPDHVPWFMSKSSGSAFAAITTGTVHWPSAYRCRALRTVRGVLVAINLIKSGVEAPYDVFWSNFTQFDQLPADWDYGGTTSSSGMTTIADLGEPLVDGCALRESMILYSANQTWLMEFSGDNNVFNFRRLWGNHGTINVNCVIEDDGTHYVFGPKDLWLHDGTQKKSLATGKVRKFIYDGLIKSKSDQCFVIHKQETNEIYFCYQSQDSAVVFRPTSTSIGCNRAAVYNYVTDLWTFDDLPFVTSATFGQSQVALDYTGLGSLTYAQIAGSYGAMADPTRNALFVSTAVNATYSIVNGVSALSTFDDTGTLGEIDANLTKQATLYKTGMDLDAIKEELRGYKLCSSVYPQARLSPESGPLTFTLGASDHSNAPIEWGEGQTFDDNFYKLDHNIAGRYLHLKMTYDDVRNFKLVGLDLDLTILGRT